MLAGRDQELRSQPHEPVERRLDGGTSRAVVDPAGRLVEDADDRDLGTAANETGRRERRRNRIDEDRARAELLGPVQERAPAERWQREREVGEREEDDASGVRRSRFCHSAVVEIPSGQAARVAQRQEGQEEMLVVHVAPSLFGPDGIFGGGERYPLELARALTADVECELLSFGREARLVRDSSGLRIRILRARAHLGGHPAHPVAAGLARAVARADVVHAHHMRSAPARAAAVRARLRGGRTAVTDHGLAGGDWGGLLPRLFDRFLTVSAYSASELRAPPSRTHVVYGGADPARYAPDGDGRRRGVLFVGRLTPHKGIDRLITALPEGAKLRIAGSEGHDARLPERDYPALLRRLAAGRDVEFLGPVPERELPALYRQAELFVLPSVHRTCYGRDIAVSELLGLSVIEAMASGTPVVCSRIGGLPEVVEDGVTGFLVEPGDVAELRARVEEVLADRELAAALGRRARERVLDRFTWRACAERCLAAYDELVSGAR